MKQGPKNLHLNSRIGSHCRTLCTSTPGPALSPLPPNLTFPLPLLLLCRVAALLSEPLGMDAAVDGLIPLCAYIGGDEPETQDAAADLCAEVETHSIVERLSAVLCWGNSTDDLKGRIAMLMFYMAKVNFLANRCRPLHPRPSHSFAFDPNPSRFSYPTPRQNRSAGQVDRLTSPNSLP